MDRADLEQWKSREVARLLALVETERRYYQEIVASIPIGLLVLSADLSIISANRAIRKIFGLRSGDPLRGRLDTLLPGWVLDRVQEVLKSGIAQTGIQVEREQDGSQPLRVGILTIRNWDDDATQEALISIEDLRGIALPAAEAPLAVPEPEPEIAAQEVVAEPEPVPEPPSAPPVAFPTNELISNLNAIVWVLELSTHRFLFVSDHAEAVLGFPPDHWVANASFWSDRVHSSDRAWVIQAYEREIPSGLVPASEFRAETADGRVVWLRETARVVNGADGQPKYLIGLTLDVTERRRLIDQLVQSERVDAISRLASRMAHDLNNMLMILTGYSEELLGGIPPDSPLRSDIQEILSATERMSGLTNQLLAFARRPGSQTTTVDLSALLNSMLAQLRSLAGEHIAFELKPSSEPVSVKADPAQLEQVITAILGRVLQAMAGAGTVTMSISHREVTEDLRRADTPLRPGSYGTITIAGTGRALEGDARTSLFESVLSGKDAVDEAAAAVSRAYGIVRPWGGDIVVSSGAVEGSVVQVFLEQVSLPRAEPQDQAPPESVVVTAPPETPRMETILVVEDEAGIRALVRKILHRQGYTVLEAAAGDEAIALVAGQSGKINLLITDMVMPNMGGRELSDRLREQRLDMKVLYVSGYTDDAGVYAGNFPPGTAFLQKPFTLGALLDKVKEVLAS